MRASLLESYKQWVKGHPAIVHGLDWLLYLVQWNPGRLSSSEIGACCCRPSSGWDRMRAHEQHGSDEIAIPPQAMRRTMPPWACCQCGTRRSWRRTAQTPGSHRQGCGWSCCSRCMGWADQKTADGRQ